MSGYPPPPPSYGAYDQPQPGFLAGQAQVTGYPQPGYPAQPAGYPQPGYPQPGYPQPGYPPTVAQPTGYYPGQPPTQTIVVHEYDKSSNDDCAKDCCICALCAALCFCCCTD